MRPHSLAACILVLPILLAGCVRVAVHGDPDAAAESQRVSGTFRIATYNTSLYAEDSGGLVRRLEADDGNARKIAAVLQRVRPDVVLLNEFDFDAEGSAADLFEQRYLAVPQAGGGDALHYPHRYFAPVNTGVPSGLDLNRSGAVGTEGRARGDDAWGYGLHPGQYGMLVLSRFPIEAAVVRSFRLLKWSALPDARQPRDPSTSEPWYPPAIWSQLRLSSKSHWDVPVRVPGGVLHVLVSHPTPPVFDGPEDRNGARNADELRLWQEYLTPGDRPWLCDDRGTCGGLAAGERFVIAGDLNNDPVDGDGRHEAIRALLDHPRVQSQPVPRSEGAEEAARRYAGLGHQGTAAHATGDFGPRTGTLRLDYLLPSVGLRVRDSGVFWPPSSSTDAAIVDGTDHRLVWVDLQVQR